jgi:hypothetical protein
VSVVAPEMLVDPRSFRRRYLPLGRVLLVVVVLLMVPAWLFIVNRSKPLPDVQEGTNTHFALSQTNYAWNDEPLGRPVPISHTLSLVRIVTPTSIAHVYAEGSNLEFVFPKGPNVCVNVPPVVYGTAAVPKVVRC